MKKRNLILLSIICIMSIIALTGLLIIAFDRQKEKEKDFVESVEPTLTPTPSPSPEPSPTPAPTPTEVVKNDEPILLGFAGDVNLDEDSYPVA